MGREPEGNATPSLDEWIADVGEEAVDATVKTAMQEIEGGATPGFSDKDAFLAYIGRRQRV
jgi:hypothetical protein